MHSIVPASGFEVSSVAAVVRAMQSVTAGVVCLAVTVEGPCRE